VRRGAQAVSRHLLGSWDARGRPRASGVGGLQTAPAARSAAQVAPHFPARRRSRHAPRDTGRARRSTPDVRARCVAGGRGRLGVAQRTPSSPTEAHRVTKVWSSLCASPSTTSLPHTFDDAASHARDWLADRALRALPARDPPAYLLPFDVPIARDARPGWRRHGDGGRPLPPSVPSPSHRDLLPPLRWVTRVQGGRRGRVSPGSRPATRWPCTRQWT